MGSPRHYANMSSSAPGATRTYCGQRVEISSTGLFAGEQTVVYNATVDGSAAETANGTSLVPTQLGVVGRYVRHYVAGSTNNPYAHFLEF
eukprot:COSAG05_NODE_21929_length_268_cov_0.615385_1_plen_89_part_11